MGYVLYLLLFALPGFAETTSPTFPDCAQHQAYAAAGEEANLCPALSIRRQVSRVLGLSCQILKRARDSDIPPVPPEIDRVPLPPLPPPTCTGTCLTMEAEKLRKLLLASRADLERAQEYQARYDFAERMANQASDTYEDILAKARFLARRRPPPQVLTPSRTKALPPACKLEMNSIQAKMIELLREESGKIAQRAQSEKKRGEPFHKEMAARELAVRRQMHRVLETNCKVTGFGVASQERIRANHAACSALIDTLDKENTSSFGSSTRIVWSLIFGSPDETVHETRKAFQRHPGLRYFLLNHSTFVKGGARQIVAMISALDGMSSAEQEFLEHLLSEKTTEAELEFLLSPDTLRVFETFTKASGGLARLRLYKIWSDTNPELAGAFRHFVKSRYEKFRALLLESVAKAKELSPLEKDLYASIIHSPELQNPETILRYVDLLLNLATADLEKDPLAIVKEITAFVWDPKNDEQVRAGKSLIRRHFAKIQAVTIEALRKFQGPVKVGDKLLRPAQMRLLETAISKTKPEDFELILDFALSLARDATITGKLNVLKSLAGDPKALGFTREFVLEHYAMIRDALLETFDQYEAELLDGNPPTLTRDQLALIRLLIRRSTGDAIGGILKFVHRLAAAPSSTEKTDAMLGLLADPDIVRETKAFASDPENHRALIRAAIDTLDVFVPEMTHPETGFATMNQVRLVERVLSSTSPRSIARALDIAHGLVRARTSDARLAVLRAIASDKDNADSVTEFFRDPDNLALLKAAILDTLTQFEKDLVDKNTALSRAQYDLFRDLIAEITGDGAATLIDYIHRFARATGPAERLAVLESVFADKKLIRSTIDYTTEKRRLALVRQAALDALTMNKRELVRPGSLTDHQYRLIEAIVHGADADSIRATLETAHNLASARTAQERMNVVHDLMKDEGGVRSVKRFLKAEKNFAILKRAALDTLRQMESELTDRDSGIISRDQFVLLLMLIDDLSPDGLLRGIDYAEKWLLAKDGKARERLVFSALTDRGLLRSAANFVNKSHALAKRVVLATLEKNRAELLKEGMTKAQWEFVRALVHESSARDFEIATRFIGPFLEAKHMDARYAAIDAFFRANPDAGERLIRLVRGSAFEPLRQMLLELALSDSPDPVTRDYFTAILRTVKPEGLALILQHRALVLKGLREAVDSAPPGEKHSFPAYLVRLKHAFRRHPAEIRAIIDRNFAIVEATTKIGLKSLNPKNLPKDMSQEEARIIRAFLRGLSGDARLKHPDPKEEGPLKVLLRKNDEAARKIIAHIAAKTGRRPADVVDAFYKNDPQLINGKIELPQATWKELGMTLTREHVYDLAEYYLERIGDMIRRGQRLAPHEIEIAKRQADHLMGFLKESDEGKPYIPHITELKRMLDIYAGTLKSSPGRAISETPATEPPPGARRGS